MSNKEDLTILHKRGPEENMPKAQPSELLYTTDSDKLFFGGKNGNIELAKKSDIGFARIEVLSEDPVNPEIGQIWILRGGSNG